MSTTRLGWLRYSGDIAAIAIAGAAAVWSGAGGWVYPVAVTVAASAALRIARTRSAWPKVWPWSLAALLGTGVVLLAVGTIAGALSTTRGIAWRFSLPWGLVCSTSGVRGEGDGFTFGGGLVLTPLIAAAIVMCFRVLWIVRGRNTGTETPLEG